MIKFKIERYRDFTEEEKKEREEWNRKKYRNDMMNYDDFRGTDKYLESILDVLITEEQFVAIRKAVLESF